MANTWNLSIYQGCNATAVISLSAVYGQVFSGQKSLSLYLDGCGPDQNCTSVCLDPTMVFNNTHTTQNCILYPLIGSLMVSGNLSDDSYRAASAMGIVPQEDTCVAIARTTIMCLDSMSAYMSRYNATNTAYYPSPAQAFGREDYYADVCGQGLATSINPDIGGVGVYYSYWVQSALSIAFFVAMKFCTSWVFWICRILSYGVLRPKNYNSAFELARAAQAKVRTQLDPLVAAMIDFQKAQCFFALALEIATLIILSSPNRMTATFGSFTMSDLSNEYDLMSAISMGGFVPITFTLLTIHIADRRSWFLLFLTTVTVLVSAITYIKLLRVGSVNPSVLRHPPAGVLECGTANPLRYCALGFFDLKKPSFWKSPGATSLCISTVMLLCLVGDHFAHIFEASAKQLMTRTDDPWAIFKFKRQAERHRRLNQTIQMLCLTIWTLFCAAYGWAFAQLFRTLSTSNPTAAGSSGFVWSFGQIVAITVWIPSIIELLYLMANGMEDGQYRITRNFKLIRVHMADKDEDEVARHGYSLISTFLQQPWAFMEAYRCLVKQDKRSSTISQLIPGGQRDFELHERGSLVHRPRPAAQTRARRSTTPRRRSSDGSSTTQQLPLIAPDDSPLMPSGSTHSRKSVSSC